MQNRSRKTIVNFRVTEQENALIAEKMILDGYVVRLDFSDVRKMVSLLSNATNNLNQISKRVNETRNIYESDIRDLQENYEKLWVQAEEIMKKLAKL